MKLSSLYLLFFIVFTLNAPSAYSEDPRELTVYVVVPHHAKGIVVNFNNVPPTVTFEEFPEVRRTFPSSPDLDFLEFSRSMSSQAAPRLRK